MNNGKRSAQITAVVLLNAITLALLLLPMERGSLFGSTGDWDSQHVGAAELLRQTILTQGTVFPQFVYGGSGANIYDFAYYGFLRPDVLVSCLIPQLEMQYIISGYNIFLVFASVNLCYVWLKRQLRFRQNTCRGQRTLCQPGLLHQPGLFHQPGQFCQPGASCRQGAFFGSVVLAAATCFLQAHRQIMFVNFMPFLLLALLGIDRLLEKKRSGLLVLSLVMICLHSFYYAPACLVVCGIYGIWQLYEKTLAEGKTLTDPAAWKPAGRALMGVGISLMIAAVLLLPAGLDILSTTKDGGRFAEEPMKLLDGTLEGLLYSPYGCGTTLLALYALLTAVWRIKKEKGLGIMAGVILFSMAVPAVSLALNGFLYARAKILTPFLPLVALITAKVFMMFFADGKEEKPPLLPVWFCLIPVLFLDSPLYRLLAGADALVLFLVILGLRAGRRNSSRSPEGRGGPRTAYAGLVMVLMIAPVLTSLAVSSHFGTWIKKEQLSQNPFTAEELEACGILQGQNAALYRMDVISDGWSNANTVPDGRVQKTSMYSSVTGHDYGSFYYETIRNPIAVNNRVALLPSENPLFNHLMGVRWLVTLKEKVPAGCQVIREKGDYALSEKKDVLPVCYGVEEQRTMDEEVFRSLRDEERLEALATCTIVESGRPETDTRTEDARTGETRTVETRTEDARTVETRTGGTRTGEPFKSHWKQTAAEEAAIPADRAAEKLEKEINRALNTRTLKEASGRQILLVQFDVNSPNGKEVTISVGNMSNKLAADSAPYPNENQHFTYLLACEEGQELSVTASEGDYTIENLQIALQPEETMKKTASEVSGAETDGWEPDGRTMFQGTVELKQDGWIITSYPYREGYQVSLDGKTVTPRKVNTAFLGVPVAAGRHEIIIRYTAPGFETGLRVTAGGMAALAALCLIEGMQQREERKRERGKKGKEK